MELSHDGRPLVANSLGIEEEDENPLVFWILGGVTCALATGMVSLFVASIDRFARSRRSLRIVRALGVTERRLAGVEARQFLAAYTVTVGVGTTAGALAAFQLARAGGAPFPLGWLLVILGATAGIGLAVSAAVVRVANWLTPPPRSGSFTS